VTTQRWGERPAKKRGGAAEEVMSEIDSDLRSRADTLLCRAYNKEATLVLRVETEEGPRFASHVTKIEKPPLHFAGICKVEGRQVSGTKAPSWEQYYFDFKKKALD